MIRFFISPDQIKENTVVLQGEDRHHLVNVLRQGPGGEIIVLNGKGEEYLVRINEITPEQVIGEIIEKLERQTEPRVKITLVQSLPKADKFEWILQKNTELGVARFQPVITERSNIKLTTEVRERKLERWRKIIKEAAEQSGRRIIPKLEPIRCWDEAIADFQDELVLIPWEGEQARSLKQVLKSLKVQPERVTVLIGPEGGFSVGEVEKARTQGAIPVTLGPRILRTETAGLVVAAALFYHFDDLEH
ncbi:MAG: 16S rRNA (uracil(1498)-N(3))-methyltransferase [Firmicutes bacterium]|nr:16S rRNA (uracil(1498)-N(3))-methyltransferase [Bacillota bacterium]